MWYEILPAAAIIYAALAFPHFSAYVTNKLLVGNMYRRNLTENSDILRYMRDRRLTNNPYLLQGLESLDDEEKKE